MFCFCFSGSFFKNLGRKKSDEPEKKKDSPEKKKVRFFGRNKSDPKEPEDEVKDPEAETNGKETTAESETEKEDSASEDEESETDKDENDEDVSQTDLQCFELCKRSVLRWKRQISYVFHITAVKHPAQIRALQMVCSPYNTEDKFAIEFA